jgi:Flp pilus assembly protein TadG
VSDRHCDCARRLDRHLDRDLDRGQATVELALATPVLCLLLLGIVQLTVVVRDQLRVIDLARVAARAASVAADPAAAAAGIAGRDPPHALRLITDVDDSTVTVTVSAVTVTDVPLIGALLPDITLSARSTMPLEPP